jgi:hypothetical protein
VVQQEQVLVVILVVIVGIVQVLVVLLDALLQVVLQHGKHKSKTHFQPIEREAGGGGGVLVEVNY